MDHFSKWRLFYKLNAGRINNLWEYTPSLCLLKAQWHWIPAASVLVPHILGAWEWKGKGLHKLDWVKPVSATPRRVSYVFYYNCKMRNVTRDVLIFTGYAIVSGLFWPYFDLLLSGLWLSITITSYWALWRLKSPASLLFTQPFVQPQIKENIKALRHWPLWGESTNDWWISRTCTKHCINSLPPVFNWRASSPIAYFKYNLHSSIFLLHLNQQ